MNSPYGYNNDIRKSNIIIYNTKNLATIKTANIYIKIILNRESFTFT